MINGRWSYLINTPKLNTLISKSFAPVKLMSVTDMSEKRVSEPCVEHTTASRCQASSTRDPLLSQQFGVALSCVEPFIN